MGDQDFNTSLGIQLKGIHVFIMVDYGILLSALTWELTEFNGTIIQTLCSKAMSRTLKC